MREIYKTQQLRTGYPKTGISLSVQNRSVDLCRKRVYYVEYHSHVPNPLWGFFFSANECRLLGARSVCPPSPSLQFCILWNWAILPYDVYKTDFAMEIRCGRSWSECRETLRAKRHFAAPLNSACPRGSGSANNLQMKLSWDHTFSSNSSQSDSETRDAFCCVRRDLTCTILQDWSN